MASDYGTDIGDVLTGHYAEMIERARRVIRSEEDARDAVQQVALTVLEAPHLLAGVERVGAWLFTLVYRRCVDIIRGNVRRAEKSSDKDLIELFEAAEEEDPFVQDELAEAISDAIRRLPEDQRDVIVWNVLEEQTFREISERTGIPMGTLMARKKRGLDRMRNMLADEGLFDSE